MSSQITQVDGCEFSTEELQQYHHYYKFEWNTVSLEQASLTERIAYFTTAVDATIDPERLRAWLRTMGIIDESEKSDQHKLYDRFEVYDYSTAPGFNAMLGSVYDTDGVNKHELDTRMMQAKAKYYNGNVEPLDYQAYVDFKEETKPKPVCPYQHMWDEGKASGSANTKDFANVKLIDIADFIGNGDEVKLSAAALGRIHDEVKDAYQERYYALAIVRSKLEPSSDDAPVFLPALESSGGNAAALKAAIALRIELRKINGTKPVIVFANGSVDASTLGIALSTAELITTECFSTRLFPGNVASDESAVVPALFDWAQLAADQGTAEYILCRPDLVLRGSELAALGLSHGFIAHRKLDGAMERILMAASCPPPHTRGALRKAYVVESSYPGPSKVQVWKREIAEYFAPLASGSKTIDDLVGELKALNKPWAETYLKFAATDKGKALARLRIAALQRARALEFSGALEVEFNATQAWLQGSTVATAFEIKTPLSTILANSSKPEDANPLEVEIPGECPFAQMYRRNPERFNHIDLKSIESHSPLKL
ncbi:hypothetical protein FBU59_002157 [Linderina macrospora]|uniref:Uncharacterized protein n=1 Tax=Linderina macrospora TaxID=4868 RepID=A0ACC1JC11_9FUNG|nr:hypothetical protein FBU59_002157 [Linderina macrospora]